MEKCRHRSRMHEAKAIKVLDMIQDAYKSNSIDGDFPVFHMPTDEEVEV